MQFVIQLFFSLSLLGFIINLVIGYFQLEHLHLFPIHLVIGLGSTFLGVLVTMMSTSYFLGTRDRLTEENRWPNISAETLEEAKIIKKNLFASCGPAMMLILLNAILAGCSYVRIIPALAHHIFAYLVIMAHARAFRATLQFHRFREKLFSESP
jgi:hypothetical protein